MNHTQHVTQYAEHTSRITDEVCPYPSFMVCLGHLPGWGQSGDFGKQPVFFLPLYFQRWMLACKGVNTYVWQIHLCRAHSLFGPGLPRPTRFASSSALGGCCRGCRSDDHTFAARVSAAIQSSFMFAHGPSSRMVSLHAHPILAPPTHTHSGPEHADSTEDEYTLWPSVPASSLVL